MSEFLQVLKRLVNGDDSVTSTEVMSVAEGEDMDTTPAFIFWATVGTPKFDVFLDFWRKQAGESEPKLANPNCYHFYGKKKKFEFSKAMSDIVAFVQILPEGGPFGDLGSTFFGLYAVYADVDGSDFRLYDEYSTEFISALGSKGERIYHPRYKASIDFSFAWLGNSKNLEKLWTLDNDIEYFTPTFTHVLGTGTTTIDSYMEKNVHAPEEYFRVVFSTGGGFLLLQDMIRRMPSDLMVFDPITGGTRAIESYWKLFDVYLEYLKKNEELVFDRDRIKTGMVNKLADIGFTPDALKWIANSDSEVGLVGGNLRIKRSDARLLMSDPRIVSMIEGAKASWTESLSKKRKKNKVKVDAVIEVLVERNMTAYAIDMVIQASMPWQFVWVGVDDNRTTELSKSQALSNYIQSKVAELENQESNGRPSKVARPNALLVSRRFSEEEKEIVNNLRPLFSDSDVVEDEEADKLLRYEDIILSYTDMIDDAVFDHRLTEMFQQRILQARSRTGSANMQLLETAIQRIQVSQDPRWNKKDENGKMLKEVVEEAYWDVKEKLKSH